MKQKKPGQKRQKLKRWEKREKKNDKLILLLFISPQFRAPAATASSIINSHFQEGRGRGDGKELYNKKL